MSDYTEKWLGVVRQGGVEFYISNDGTTRSLRRAKRHAFAGSDAALKCSRHVAGHDGRVMPVYIRKDS